MKDLFNPELGCGVRELLFEPLYTNDKSFFRKKNRRSFN